MDQRQRRKIRTHLPEGKPRYIRVYDAGEDHVDRYTVVFTGNYRGRTGGEFIYLGMSGMPTHPQGVCQHGSSRHQIDRPRYSHIGKPIDYDDLPLDCKSMVVLSYSQLWDLPLDSDEIKELSGYQYE